MAQREERSSPEMATNRVQEISNETDPSTAEEDEQDGFDRLPDPLLRVIFTSLADVKTLIRCRAVSRRFNSLATQTDSLVLAVDRVVSTNSESTTAGASFIAGFLKSVIKSIHYLVSAKKTQSRNYLVQNSPLQILKGFERVQNVEIELPSGDLKLEKGAIVRWKAVFGRTLRTCVIVAMRGIREARGAESDEVGGGGEGGVGEGLKMRVVWTISALIASSSRHFAMKEVIKEHKELKFMEVRDKEGEGRLLVDAEGLRECREYEDLVGESNLGSSGAKEKSRTTVPAVRMRMWHQQSMELKSRVKVDGAMVVVVRPADASVFEDSAACYCCEEAIREDEGLARAGFDGLYDEIVQSLLKNRSYMLEMNSF